jgi:Flp pilus assembly protein TadD
MAAPLAGCAAAAHDPPTQPSADYQTIDKDTPHDTDTATRQNEQALAQYEKGDLTAAEQSARAALTADITFGPAHNTLGMIYFRQSELYLAAWEFQYAIKLMPRQAEAHGNLGLVYETAGKWDQAVEAYEDALKLAPDDEEIIGNLARDHLRRGDRGDDVRQLLERVAGHDDRPEWRLWAREQLARLQSPATEPGAP